MIISSKDKKTLEILKEVKTMNIKVLHIVGGKFTNGAVKGAQILHEALIENNIGSKFINDTPSNLRQTKNDIIFVNNTTLKKIFYFICTNLEKFQKQYFFHLLEKLLH